MFATKSVTNLFVSLYWNLVCDNAREKLAVIYVANFHDFCCGLCCKVDIIKFGLNCTEFLVKLSYTPSHNKTATILQYLTTCLTLLISI